MKFFHADTATLAQNIVALERSGEYEESLNILSEFWADKSVPPDTEGLSNRDSAEVFLRCGSVIGFIGHKKQVSNSQVHSRNLLTTARELFLRDYDVEKIAECENYIALSYWRSGEKTEADTWIEEALYRRVPNSSQVRLHSYIIKALVLLAQDSNSKIISLLKDLEKDFLKYGDDSLKGDFYNYLGLASRRLGDNKEAFARFETAKVFHTKSGHKSYLAAILNNLAMLHREEKRFKKSHAAIDSAIEIFSNINDRTREGFALDTKALTYADEGQ
jgi:tetratricopeptide (TPR) repeat protein